MAKNLLILILLSVLFQQFASQEEPVAAPLSKCLYETCDYDHPYRLISRMTGRFIMQDINPTGYIVSSYLEYQTNVLPGSDVWVTCQVPGVGSVVRNLASDRFVTNITDNQTPIQIEYAVTLALDLVPGYAILAVKCDLNSDSKCLIDSDIANPPGFGFKVLNEDNIAEPYSHWIVHPLDFIHGPNNFCNETDGKYYRPYLEDKKNSILCNEDKFVLISRTTGGYLALSAANEAMAIVALDGSEDLLAGSNLWHDCFDDAGYYTKNQLTAKYLSHNADSVYNDDFKGVFWNTYSLISKTDFLGFSLIRVVCNESDQNPSYGSCAVGIDEAGKLVVKNWDVNDLSLHWIKQLI